MFSLQVLTVGVDAWYPWRLAVANQFAWLWDGIQYIEIQGNVDKHMVSFFEQVLSRSSLAGRKRF